MAPAIPMLVGGGLLALSLLVVVGSASAPAPSPVTKPTLAWVKMQLARYGYPLPAVGRAYIVGIVRRTTDGSQTPKDPWDDWIGILKNLGDGRFVWQYAVGTCEPGWAPMMGQGRIPTAPEGVSRLVAPQFSPDAYGGGYHHHNKNHPAFRQNGTVKIELFSKTTRRWRGPINSRAYQNFHTTGSLGFDWRRAQQQGVGDHSHGCLVALAPEEHRQLLALGGWTPEIDGVRLGVVMLPWDDRRTA